MNSKAFILGLYLVALFIILNNYYKNEDGSGMPPPQLITAPSYLYAVLGLAANFTGGLTTVLAAGLTLGLYYKTHNSAAKPKEKAPVKTTSRKKTPATPYQAPAGKK